MMIRSYALIVVGGVVAALTASAGPHHGAAGLFDETQTVEVTGAVKSWSRQPASHPGSGRAR